MKSYSYTVSVFGHQSTVTFYNRNRAASFLRRLRHAGGKVLA